MMSVHMSEDKEDGEIGIENATPDTAHLEDGEMHLDEWSARSFWDSGDLEADPRRSPSRKRVRSKKPGFGSNARDETPTTSQPTKKRQRSKHWSKAWAPDVPRVSSRPSPPTERKLFSKEASAESRAKAEGAERRLDDERRVRRRLEHEISDLRASELKYTRADCPNCIAIAAKLNDELRAARSDHVASELRHHEQSRAQRADADRSMASLRKELLIATLLLSNSKVAAETQLDAARRSHADQLSDHSNAFDPRLALCARQVASLLQSGQLPSEPGGFGEAQLAEIQMSLAARLVVERSGVALARSTGSPEELRDSLLRLQKSELLRQKSELQRSRLRATEAESALSASTQSAQQVKDENVKLREEISQLSADVLQRTETEAKLQAKVKFTNALLQRVNDSLVASKVAASRAQEKAAALATANTNLETLKAETNAELVAAQQQLASQAVQLAELKAAVAVARRDAETSETERTSLQQKADTLTTELAKLKQLTPDESNLLCTICLERPICMMLTPCNHLVYCEICTPTWLSKQKKQTCPHCRKAVRKAVKVFLPNHVLS
eukprot:TRINITY_DN5069_c0_g1_i1.p1 TRINITY_DN5069_c0_g1~~TRINITY_DN5069_c0_g1_i1.p1  ORF type:complete len:559 (-),score=83.15 TRINITY_DN5069_c0_g1_i1:72-1748(-)